MRRFKLLDEEDIEILDWNDTQDLKAHKSAKQKSKSKRAKSIHKGIEKYFEKKQLRKDIGEDFDDYDLDFFDDDDDVVDLYN